MKFTTILLKTANKTDFNGIVIGSEFIMHFGPKQVVFIIEEDLDSNTVCDQGLNNYLVCIRLLHDNNFTSDVS